MSQILALSEDCINKIAAGEVIERPASVVKELVENSIDAGATLIQVRILEGGRELIRVSDNGRGISESDLDICFLRYTTSKIRSADDLAHIQTNGFRGEALSSISAVSVVDIFSKTESQESAYCLKVRQGLMESKEPTARANGTTFEVRKLFYNTPVRAKFLAGIQTETNKVTDILTRLSLIHPHIGFEFHHDTKEILKTRQGKPEIRIAEVLGPKVAKFLIPISYESEKMAISGYIGTQEISKGRRSQQFLYLDNRPIWNPGLLKVIENGYQTFHPGRYPVYVINFELNPGDFDVNVHPTKKEVRFTQAKDLYRVTTRVIRDTIRDHLESLSGLEVHDSQSGQVNLDIPKSSPSSYSHHDSSQMTQAMKSDSDDFAQFEWEHLIVQEEPSIKSEPQDLFASNSESVIPFPVPKTENQSLPSNPPRQAKPLFFQWNKQFVLTETTNGLIMVDQYLAHMRVLFEQASRNLADHTLIASQELLFPELLEVSALQNSIIEENIDRFLVLGFNIQEFGHLNWQLRGIPAELANHRALQTFEDLLKDLEEEQQPNQDIRLQIALAWARTSAIPRGQVLSYEEMNHLINHLFLTDNPYKTPKGKNIFIRLTLEEILQKFNKEST